MPTYDYECDACGHTFEHWQTMSSNRLRKCPDCGLKKLRRLIGSGAGVIFKGSGFYETDYKKKSGSAGKDDGGGDSAGDAESAKAEKLDKKTDEKTASKSDGAAGSKRSKKPKTSSDEQTSSDGE